jgi:hydrogenase maturation protease
MNTANPNNPTSASNKLVIGIGNEFRGDDGVGLFIARQLGRKFCLDAPVVESRGEGTELMSLWLGYDLVVLVDAVHSDSAPGKIFRFEVPGSAIPKALFPRHSTHAFGVLEAIELGKTLGNLPSRMIIYGIEGGTFDEGVEISSEVLSASKNVIDLIARDIAFELKT